MDEHKVKTAVERLIALQKIVPKRKTLHFYSLAAAKVIHTYKYVLNLDQKLLFDQEIFKRFQYFFWPVMSPLSGEWPKL